MQFRPFKWGGMVEEEVEAFISILGVTSSNYSIMNHILQYMQCALENLMLRSVFPILVV